MKKIIFMLAVVSMLVSCNDGKKVEETVVSEPKNEVYLPQHELREVDLTKAKKYMYFAAPKDSPATSVEVNYNPKVPYAEPIEIVYHYSNGDMFTYRLPADFGLWANEAGRLRVVADNDCTVWLQGQTKRGKFHEFVFFGDPKNNGKKIKPNSYRNLPAGEVVYRH